MRAGEDKVVRGLGGLHEHMGYMRRINMEQDIPGRGAESHRRGWALECTTKDQ